MENYIGKKLEGRYEILELIGFGGMAFVYKAYDIMEKRYAAVKILKEEFLQNEEFKRRFRNESKAIAMLSHPNIVKVYDVNFSDHIQYIVMEFIDGITLKEYIEQQKKVGWKEAIHFTIQILRALQHAHDNGIVHRDIKPQNMMLLQDGTIKVMDFGIARFARENGRTISDKAIGSVHYISPEQAQGAATDERADIYSVGVMLYEMLTGRLPFDGESAVSIAIKQMQEEPRHPSEMNPSIPGGLEEIVLRAMQKDPELRYQSAAEMLRDIDEFKHNPDVVFAYRYLNTDGTTKYFDKVSAAAAEAAYDEDEEEPKKRSYTINILAGVAAACVILAGVALFFFLQATDRKVAEISMPNLIGIGFEQAQANNPNLKIILNAQEASPDYDANVITDQNIEEGTKVKVNAEVLVTVSTGIRTYVVEDFANELFSTVRAKLEAQGLVVNPIESFNDTVASGLVISTNPGEGTELKKGDQITVVVSLGSRDLPITVPNLIDMTELQAKAELTKAGLVLGERTQVYSDKPQGTVVSQTPNYPEKLEKGSRVNIEVSNGIPMAPEIRIPIQFPAGLDNITSIFDIYVNDVLAAAYSVNPTEREVFEIPLTLTGETINNLAPILEKNNVVVRVNNADFAHYEVDFTDGSYVTLSSPDFRLLDSSSGGASDDDEWLGGDSSDYNDYSDYSDPYDYNY